MIDLPEIVSTRGWTWEQFEPIRSEYEKPDFWVGTDLHGNRWLTKLRGREKAYREIVFARLAQAMGWSCQSSVFIKMDRHAIKKIGIYRSSDDTIHAAHWLLSEHQRDICSDLKCAVASLHGSKLDRPTYEMSTFTNKVDVGRGEVATYLFGAWEPPGYLITTDHEVVIVDSEYMFYGLPHRIEANPLWSTPNGRDLTLAVCNDLLALPEDVIEHSVRKPIGVKIKCRVKAKLNSSRLQASKLVGTYLF